jgi:hypothetical protein
MWGYFETSLLPSNLSLPPYQLSMHSSPATPMASQKINLGYPGTYDGYHYETITFTPMNDSARYASLLSSSHTLGSDFSHGRSQIASSIRTLHVQFTPAKCEAMELLVNEVRGRWLEVEVEGSDDFGDTFRQHRLNPTLPQHEEVAWAPYDFNNFFGQGVMFHLLTDTGPVARPNVVGVVFDKIPEVSDLLGVPGA